MTTTRKGPAYFLGVTIAPLLLVLAIVAIGYSTLAGMLKRDAEDTAALWQQSTLSRSGGSLAELSAPDVGGDLLHSLEVAGIDALVRLMPGGAVVPVLPTGAETAADFRDAVAPSLPQMGADPYSLQSGAYGADRIRWFQFARFRNWVVLPETEPGRPRFAVRIDQSAVAAGLVTAFHRELIYSGSVAAITFFSFMAGFTYRARKLMAENEAIRFLALHDELTGLPNRKQFEEFLRKSIDACTGGDRKTALFVLDLDGFKLVNDTLGHPVGDGLLKATAKRLKGSLRGGDLLARLSGDEFAIVVPHLSDTAMLAPLAERLLHLLTTPFRVDGHEIGVGGSIGVAVAPDNGSDGATLMRNADFALYRAKSEGKRTWRFFDPKMAEDLASRRSLQDGLSNALQHDRFTLLYQPQVDLRSGRINGYEAMLRWRLPGKGLVPAAVFLSIAEESGLVIPIGEWVIAQVARDCQRLPADRYVSINLSAAQLKRDGIETFIRDTLAAHDVAPERVEIEVNESILGRHEATALARLEKIRSSGVSIVMDSFGVGTLSLGLLSQYPVDKVKIDRAFTSNIRDDQKTGAVLAALCNLCASMGIRVGGTGVETAEHAELLRAAGCQEAQGYYFAHPMPIEEVLLACAAEQGPAKSVPIAASA